MDERSCPICKKALGDDPRSKFCSRKCRWRGFWKRSVGAAAVIETLPLAALPADAEEILPVGPERSLVAMQLAIVGRAPAGARGYRVGIKHGLSQIQRWFPAARRSELPMFLLDPFECPAVPIRGLYAVVYLDGHFMPIGGPRFTVPIDQTVKRVPYSQGDRTYRPRIG